MTKHRAFMNRWSRKLHRWGTTLVVLPLFLVIATGILLLLKDQSDWVQPPTAQSVRQELLLDWDELLASASSVEEAEIRSWDDVDRVDIRPGRGIAKVRGRNRWEIQIDMGTGGVLQAAYRRSDLIESLHDGSFFSDWVKLLVFLPSAIILLVLWVTGIWLWLMPHIAKRRRISSPSIKSVSTL